MQRSGESPPSGRRLSLTWKRPSDARTGWRQNSRFLLTIRFQDAGLRIDVDADGDPPDRPETFPLPFLRL